MAVILISVENGVMAVSLISVETGGVTCDSHQC